MAVFLFSHIRYIHNVDPSKKYNSTLFKNNLLHLSHHIKTLRHCPRTIHLNNLHYITTSASSHPKLVKFRLLNVRSLSNKSFICQDKQLNLFLITETWINMPVSDSFISHPLHILILFFCSFSVHLQFGMCSCVPEFSVSVFCICTCLYLPVNNFFNSHSTASFCLPLCPTL